jgi:hypothetical protein
MIDWSILYLQWRVKRYGEEGITNLGFNSGKPSNILNKTRVEVEERIVEVRKAMGFGSKQMTNLVNDSLNIEYK